jgi:inosine-uridine nucleoside N-ribohydrolase
MRHKVVILADPGIDTAFALALALNDPELEVLGVGATAGNVSPEQATRNVQIVIEQIDPGRWPRVGAALPVAYDVDGRQLHGPDGLGGANFPCAQLHHPHPSDKLLIDEARLHPKEITLITMGPLTVLARAMDRDPELVALLQRVICLGGSWHEPGNATPAAEFHFFCDPEAARQVLRAGVPITLVPLDVMRKIVLSPSDLLELPNPESRTCRFLGKIVPHALGATSNLYGIEGFHLKDVAGVAALTLPGGLSTRPMVVDVETRGELTRGMTVMDVRWVCRARPNVDLAIGIDVAGVRAWIDRTLRRAA